MARKRPLPLISQAQSAGRSVLHVEHDGPAFGGMDLSDVDYTCGACGRVLVEHKPGGARGSVLARLVLRCQCGAYNEVERIAAAASA